MSHAFEGRPVDRVPFFPCIAVSHACFAAGRDFREALADPRLGVRLLLDANRMYGSDATRVQVTPPRLWYEEKLVRMEGDRLVQLDRRTNSIEGYFDTEGGGKLVPLRPPEPIRTAEHLAQFNYPTAEELIDAGCMDPAREATEAAHESDMFVVGVAPGQTVNFLVQHCGGPTEALLLIADNPEFVSRVFDIGVRASIEVIKAFAHIGVDGAYIGDSYASGSVISPTTYESLCSPAYDRVVNAAHLLGLKVYKHCCGNYSPFLRRLASSALDGMEGMDPTCGMSVGRTREILGDRMALIGGVSCLTLWQGTAEQVSAEARACIAAGGSEGRYILGTTCAVPRYTPVENMFELADCVRSTT
jgi:uroporphyrinogen-III decarboxylase